jgi:hypothetical protein
MLPDVARRDERLSKIECDALASAAPERIGNWVVIVNEWRLENYNPKQGKTSPPQACMTFQKRLGATIHARVTQAKNTRNVVALIDRVHLTLRFYLRDHFRWFVIRRDPQSSLAL